MIIYTAEQAQTIDLNLCTVFGVEYTERQYQDETIEGEDIIGSFTGRTHTEETKQLMSEVRAGKTHSEETKQKMSESGKNKSPETLARMSAWQKGVPKSEECKANLRKIRTGTKASPETKAKMSEARKGKCVHDKAHYERLAEQMRGKKRPTVVCPHCGKEGGVGTMPRWHFDNCKQKEG